MFFIFIKKVTVTYILIEKAILHNNDPHIVNQDQNKYSQSAKQVKSDQLRNHTINLMTKERRKKI